MKNAVGDGTTGQTVFVGKESGMSKAANCYVLGCGHILGLLKQLIQDYVCTPEPNGNPESILTRMKLLKITPKNQSKFDVFMQLCYNLNSKLRLASPGGATVGEMQN